MKDTNSWSSSLCSFLQPSTTSSPLSSDYSLSTLFSDTLNLSSSLNVSNICTMWDVIDIIQFMVVFEAVKTEANIIILILVTLSLLLPCFEQVAHHCYNWDFFAVVDILLIKHYSVSCHCIIRGMLAQHIMFHIITIFHKKKKKKLNSNR